MGKYPNIKDDDFYKKINKIYSKYKIPQKKKSFKEICMPEKYQLQMPQQFVSQFLNPETPYKGVLVYHRIGAGKTCTAVRVGEVFKKKRNIIVVLPASLKGNFRNELRSLCAGEEYITKAERKQLSQLHPSDNQYKEIIKKTDDRIDKYYQIFSYNKFIDNVKDGRIKLKNTLLIIDEIQNMVSEEGTYYSELYDLIKKSPEDLRIVLLSATPMFDKPFEIGLTINLLRPLKEFPNNSIDFDKKFISVKKDKKNNYKLSMKNIDLFKTIIRGYVSYFRGAPPYVFPEMKIRYIKCPMSDFQYASYKAVLRNEQNETNLKLKRQVNKDLNVGKLPNNFFIGTRFVSNIVFPNKKVGDEGLRSLTNHQVLNNLDKYSTKFDKIINKIRNASGKVFIYSSFKEYAGLKSLIRVLEAHGYRNYSDFGEGVKRFAIWSGDEDINYKEEIKSVFNLKKNLNGSKLKIILGSSSIKEGVSFAGVRQVHILDPYWNLPRLEQVIGRASRFCSHKDLELEKRNVKVYIYLATCQEKDIETVDEYIHKLSLRKNKLVNEFELAVKQSAIDCDLNTSANMDKDNKYICDI
jgi:superfamily II DNA or RNA helicase